MGLMPTLASQSCIACALNSGPLSERMYSGVPWRRSSGYSASSTSSAPILVHSMRQLQEVVCANLLGSSGNRFSKLKLGVIRIQVTSASSPLITVLPKFGKGGCVPGQPWFRCYPVPGKCDHPSTFHQAGLRSALRKIRAFKTVLAADFPLEITVPRCSGSSPESSTTYFFRDISLHRVG